LASKIYFGFVFIIIFSSSHYNTIAAQLRRLIGLDNYTTVVSESIIGSILHHDHSITDVELFYRIAASIHPTSDKITVPGSIVCRDVRIVYVPVNTENALLQEIYPILRDRVGMQYGLWPRSECSYMTEDIFVHG